MICNLFLPDDAELMLAVARRLAGGCDPEQVLPVTLAELGAARPGVTWVFLERSAAGRLRARSSRRLAPVDLASLAAAACGDDDEVEVDASRIAAIPYEQEASWQAHPSGTVAPEVVLAAFVDPGEERVSAETLSTLLTLVAGARDRARELWLLRRETTIDPLTGLLNRRALLEAAAREQQQARRTLAPLSVLFVDIDHFKQINDQHGHRTGDRALVSLAATLERVLRESDTVGRLGGDEFLVLLPHTGPTAAARVARSIAALVAATAVVVDGVHLHLSVTIGVASLGDGPDDLIDLADQRMLRGKRGRREARAAGNDAERDAA